MKPVTATLTWLLSVSALSGIGLARLQRLAQTHPERVVHPGRQAL